MSYWIYLKDENGDTCEVDNHEEGGIYALGGTTKAELNVTYNYADKFKFRELHHKKASDSITQLVAAVLSYGTERDPDYWKSTPGNVGHVCWILMKWAMAHPDAIWYVS